MIKDKKLLATGAVLILSFIVIVFSNSTHGNEGRYEINPEITLPPYQNDLGRIIDAYERMTDRMMTMTERNFGSISYDVKDVSNKLVSIDGKIAELSARMAKIEKALNIEQTERKIEIKSDANDNSNKQVKEQIDSNDN